MNPLQENPFRQLCIVLFQAKGPEAKVDEVQVLPTVRKAQGLFIAQNCFIRITKVVVAVTSEGPENSVLKSKLVISFSISNPHS
jgi:hypothetical protein